MRKELLVRRIAKDLFLREDVVEEVLDRFMDLAVEEIVTEGEFKLHRLFSVGSVAYKAYEAGKGTVPAHRRLRIRLSEGVQYLFKARQANPNLVVTADNWRQLLTDRSTPEKAEAEPLDSSQAGDLYNPLIDED